MEKWLKKQEKQRNLCFGEVSVHPWNLLASFELGNHPRWPDYKYRYRDFLKYIIYSVFQFSYFCHEILDPDAPKSWDPDHWLLFWVFECLCVIRLGCVILLLSVVDPHHVDADPDSTCHPDAYPEYAFYLMRIRIWLFTLSRIRVRIQILASK